MTLADQLRSRLARPPAEPLLAGDMPDLPARSTVAAAVLVPVTARSEPGVILTVRRDDLRTHAGQIAFPGGRIDPGEAAEQAAVREAWEELALEPSLVTLAGRMGEYRTVTGYSVTPVIGVVPPDLPLVPHDREVADWFEAPLAHLLDPSHHHRRTAVFAGRERSYWQIEWEGRIIWGATAAMLVNLSRRLRPA